MKTEKLDVVYGSNQSYYGKAKVNILDNGTKELISYKTKVAIITKGGNFIRLWEGCSQTTMKHINDFREQNNLPSISATEWKKMPVWENHTQKVRLKLYGNDKKKDEIYELEQITTVIKRLERRSKEIIWRDEFERIMNLFKSNRIGCKYTKNGIILEKVRC
jgi:hypothetical protein